MTYMPDIPDQDRDALASYDRLAEDGPEERYTEDERLGADAYSWLPGGRITSAEYVDADRAESAYLILTIDSGEGTFRIYADAPTIYGRAS